MRRRGDQVRHEAGGLAAAFDENRLVVGNVTRRGQTANAGQDLGLTLDELKRHTFEVVREIAAGGALVRVPRELQLARLHDVLGPWQRQQQLITSRTSTTLT